MEMPKKHSLFINPYLVEISLCWCDSKTWTFPALLLAHEANKIMHIALPIGKHSVLMGSDVPEILGKHNLNETRSKISISALKVKKKPDKLFNGLSANGQIEMPIADSPWGSYFGMFRDKYGIEWMVDFDPKYKGQV
jgi:PhnB protein